jgi:hypothetical protein
MAALRRDPDDLDASPPERPFRIAATALCCLSVLAGSAVLAQSGGSGGGGAAGGATSSMGGGAGGALSGPNQAVMPPLGSGGRAPTSRHQVEQRQRAAGAALHPEREREQLRILNELSRTLAPGVPMPAPGLDRADARR